MKYRVGFLVLSAVMELYLIVRGVFLHWPETTVSLVDGVIVCAFGILYLGYAASILISLIKNSFHKDELIRVTPEYLIFIVKNRRSVLRTIAFLPFMLSFVVFLLDGYSIIRGQFTYQDWMTLAYLFPLFVLCTYILSQILYTCETVWCFDGKRLRLFQMDALWEDKTAFSYAELKFRLDSENEEVYSRGDDIGMRFSVLLPNGTNRMFAVLLQDKERAKGFLPFFQ